VIALDTNVLVRYFLQDDPVQSPIANRLVESLTQDDPGFLSREVLVELFWVLERKFRLPRSEIVELLRTIADLQIWRIEAPERFVSAIMRYKRGGAGFADQMIRLASKDAGCVGLVTFDISLSHEKDVQLLA
jgi:predicted nucleic-acid-binding protein